MGAVLGLQYATFGDAKGSNDVDTAVREALLDRISTAAVAIDARMSKPAFKAAVQFFIPRLVQKFKSAAAALWDVLSLDEEALDNDDWGDHFENAWNKANSSDVIRILAAEPTAFEKDWFEVAVYIDDASLAYDLCIASEPVDSSSALYAACAFGQLDVVKMLLDRDGSVPPQLRDDGRPVAGWLADGSIVLHWGGISPWGWESPSLLMAARAGHVDVVRHILQWLRSHPDHANPDQSMMAAVGVGLIDEVVELIAGGVDLATGLEQLSGVSDTYLTVACDRADVAMVSLLLENGASLSVMGHSPPLLSASTIGGSKYSDWPPLSVENESERRAEIVRLLVAAGAREEERKEAQGVRKVTRVK